MKRGPLFNYYGGKWRAAPRYPRPTYGTIVEPFAGAAGYATRYPHLDVVLVEKNPVIAEMWRFLTSAGAANDIRSIPEVESTRDLPAWVPAGARSLVGFSMNAATDHPCVSLSAGRRKLRAMGRNFEGWNAARRERTAQQAALIGHWKIIEGDFSEAPDVEATWFIDPPYNNPQGARYRFGSRGIDFEALSAWSRQRRGQVMVCENEGASWLPFAPFANLKPGLNGKGSREVMWYAPPEGSRDR